MKSTKITPVILCGGSGARLWPLSRAGFPKQFLVLSGSNSLFQQATERIYGLATDDIEVGETLVVMVVHDLAEAKKHALLKHHGYSVNVSIE